MHSCLQMTLLGCQWTNKLAARVQQCDGIYTAAIFKNGTYFPDILCIMNLFSFKWVRRRPYNRQVPFYLLPCHAKLSCHLYLHYLPFLGFLNACTCMCVLGEGTVLFRTFIFNKESYLLLQLHHTWIFVLHFCSEKYIFKWTFFGEFSIAAFSLVSYM